MLATRKTVPRLRSKGFLKRPINASVISKLLPPLPLNWMSWVSHQFQKLYLQVMDAFLLTRKRD